MSGIDEQDTDVPVCSLCGERPLFWSLYPTIDGDIEYGSLYLFSDKYLENSKLSRLTDNGFSDLSAINSVKCRPTTRRAFFGKRHVFGADSEMFEAVMRLARREKK